MKKLLFTLICLLCVGNVSASFIGIGDRTATRDTLAIPFYILDSLGVPVDDATGDSLFITVTSPAGVEVLSDSMLFSDGRITEYLVEDYGNMYTFSDRISDLDGSSTADGSFSYLMLIHDQSLGLQTPYYGNFQIINSTFDGALDSIGLSVIASNKALDSLGKVIDSLETATVQRDELLDSLESISTVLDVVRDSLQFLVTATGFSTHSAADIWAVVTRTLTTADWITDADLVVIIDSVNAIIDSLQSQSTWVAKEASLFDGDLSLLGTLANQTLIIDSLQAALDSIQLYLDATISSRSTFDESADSILLANRAEIAKQNADSVWMYLLGGSHPATSAGKRLRDVSTNVVRVALSRGMAGSTANIVLLDLSASTASGSYDPSRITNVETGETGYIIEYDEVNQAGYLFRDMKTPFSNGDEFKISAWGGFLGVVNDGRVRGATSNTFTLNPLASGVENIYANQTVLFSSGVGADGAYKIKSFNQSTGVATIYDAFYEIPDDSTMYIIIGLGDGFETRFMDSLRGEPIPVVASDTNIFGQILGLMPSDWTAADSAAFQGLASGLTLNEIALIVDSILSANHGLGPWTTGGTGTGPNTVFIYAIDSSAIPDDTLTGIDIFVNNLTGSPEASGKTNSLGFTTVSLTFDTWNLLAGTNITNYSFDGIQFTNTNNPDTFSILGYLDVTLPPADPSKGLIEGFVKSVLGVAKAGVIITLALETTMNVTSTSPGGYTVGDGIAYDTTDVNGYFSFEVPRSSTYNDTLKSLYNILGELNKIPQFVVPNINVPDVGNVDITDEINNQ